jgi:hypothetical protein
VPLGPGSRLRCIECTTEIIVIRSPAHDVTVMCDGHPMMDLDTFVEESNAEALAVVGRGTQLGKRYADEEVGLEVLCTKGGTGSLSCGGRELIVRQAQPLPSSD